LKSTLERTPGSRVVLDVEVPPEEMAPEIEQAVRKLSREVRIPGFRPGKAPAHLVERALGRPRILREALSPVVTRAYLAVLDEQGLSPLEQPDIQVREFEDGQPLHFVATVSIRPEVHLGDYAAVRVPPETQAVTEEDVDAALEDLRRARGPWAPVEEPAADGLMVMLRTVGRLADGPRIEENRVEGVLGTGHLRPAVEAAVRGQLPGAVAECDVVFPDDDASTALRGRSAHLRIEVLEVRRQELPELDDAFAAEASDVGTLEELRAQLGNTLRQMRQAEAEQIALRAASARVIDEAEVDLADVMVERAVDNLVGELAAAGRPSGDRSALRPVAERSVKAQLVMEALARAAGVWPSEADVDREISRQAARSGLDPAHYRRLANRPETRPAITADLARNLAALWLREHAVLPAGSDAGQQAPAD